MNFWKNFKNRETINFSRNKYELIFSIFMFIPAFFMKNNSYVKYPEIFYPLFFLLFLNFFVNRYFIQKEKVKVYFIDLISIGNILAISQIIYFSGKSDSILWVMFLLPIFTIAVTGELLDFYLIFFIIEISLLSFYFESFKISSLSFSLFFIKSLIIYGSGLIIYKEVFSRKVLENEVMFKRWQVNELLNTLKDLKSAGGKDINSTKTEYLATALHDIKNLITIIHLTAQILEKEENINKNDFKKITSSARMAADLAKYSLSIAKDEKIEIKEIDIIELIDEIIVLMDYKIKPKKIIIEKEYSNHISKIKSNRILLQRVLINILANSISFLPENGVIKISVFEENNKLKIIISDNGPGFPSEILEKIEPFKTTRSKSGGTGLGLSGSFEIIKDLGGTFSIYNSPNGGAVTEIGLPL